MKKYSSKEKQKQQRESNTYNIRNSKKKSIKKFNAAYCVHILQQHTGAQIIVRTTNKIRVSSGDMKFY